MSLGRFILTKPNTGSLTVQPSRFGSFSVKGPGMAAAVLLAVGTQCGTGSLPVTLPKAVAPVNTVAPALNHTTATTGDVITCGTGTWAHQVLSYSYQWQRGGVDIGGATASSYTVVIADSASDLTCIVTAHGAESTAVATSNTAHSENVVPANTLQPTVSPPTLVTGGVFACDPGTWTHSPAFTYQWKRNFVSIAGQTASTYTSVSADVGQPITCVVTGTNGAGSASENSPAGYNVTGAPVNTVTPTLDNATPHHGDTIVCVTGTWTQFPVFSYQWKRGGTSIAGATGNNYVPVDADVGQVISCTLTGTNAIGSASATTAGSSAVIGNLTAPVITTDGAVSGNSPGGPADVGDTLSITDGTWWGAGLTLSYQWHGSTSLANPVTNSTYVISVADGHGSIWCTVTASDGTGWTQSVDGNFMSFP